MTENYSNFFVSVLAVGLDATTDPTDVVVATGDGDLAPVTPPFRFTVDREVFICSGGVDVDTLVDCSRAQEGTTMAQHNPGAYVRHGLTAAQAARFEAGGGGGGTTSGAYGINVVSVYSAVHDGVTDDGPKIQSALNAASAAGGGLVYCEAGVWGIKATINIPTNVELIGDGDGATVFKAIATFTGTRVIYGNGVQFAKVRGITVDGNGLVARGISIGAGGSAAGHNTVSNTAVRNCTTVGIDAGAEVGGSETHVIHCNVTLCPTSIRSGMDNEITLNNMGSFTTYGIDLQGGGNSVAFNHPVSNSSGTSVCLRVLTGVGNVIEGNYFDSGGAALAGPMVLVQPTAGNTVRGNQIVNNFFLAPTILTDALYPCIHLDMTNGTINSTMIEGNTAIGQDTTHRFSAVVQGTNGPTDTQFRPGPTYFCVDPYTGFTPSLVGSGLIYGGPANTESATLITKPVAPRSRYIDIAVTATGNYTVNSNFGPGYLFTVTTASGFTIVNPTNKVTGKILTFRILNSSGGAMGTITWGSDFNFGGHTWTNPANGFSRSITFWCDGTKWRVDSFAADS